MKQKKYKKRFSWGIRILCILLIECFIFNGRTVYGFEDYRVTTSNDFIITVPQRKFSGSSTEDSIRYKTQGWYLFQGATRALDDDSVDSYSHGFKLSSEFGDKTEPNSAGVYYQDFVTDADEIVKKMLEWYSVEELAGGVTVYACRAITVYRTVSGTEKTVGTYYNYPDLVEVAEWSGGTKRAFKESYDIEITIIFGATGFSIRVIDEDGEEPDGYSNTYDVDGTILYGQTLDSIKYPGNLVGYEYVGYEWSNGSGYIKTGTGTSTGKYVVDYDNIGDHDLVLTFRYKKAGAAPTAIPTTIPGTTITATPTPLPTVTPTPTASAPTPTPTPSSEFVTEEKSGIYYFTTDKGYNIDDIASSTTYTLAKYNGFTRWGTLAASTPTKRSSSYLVGTDENGNKWHFIADGTNATYVHPSVYNGYDVNTTEIRYITELTFPSTVTRSGTTYTVVSIGGGTATYRPEADVTKTETTTTDEYYDDRIFWGEYVYSYHPESSSSYSYSYHNLEYFYGVIGNGRFVNEAEDYEHNSSGGGYKNYYEKEYHVYNTTLKEVTIPETVTEILPYAFMYCQTLTTIHGGEGLLYMGSDATGSYYTGSSRGTGHAFTAATYKVSELSDVGSLVEDNGDEYGWECYYYYNESCSTDAKTQTMLEWEDAVRFQEYMGFPELPSLKVLGDYAFAYHSNMVNTITLPNKLTTVRVGAFQGCGLDAVTVPANVTVISGEWPTLGSKGRVIDKTVIFSEPDAQGTAYGVTNRAYYTVKAGYPVAYQPNSGTGEAKEFKSDIAYNTQEMAFAGNNFYVTPEGGIYSSPTTGSGSSGSNYLADIVVPKEIAYQVGDTCEIYYYDEAGDLWWFGSYGGDYYNLKFEPEGEIAQIAQWHTDSSSPWFVYLTTDGHLYETYYNISSSTLTQVTNALLSDMTFTYASGDFYDSYGSADFIGTDGKCYWIDLESYALSSGNLGEVSFGLPDGVASYEYLGYYRDTSGGSARYQQMFLCTMQDGTLALHRMETSSTSRPSGSYYGIIYDTSTLVLTADGAPLTKADIKECQAFAGRNGAKNAAAGFIYLYLADGTLWYMDAAAMTDPVCLTGSGVTLTKCIIREYDDGEPMILALDTQGRLRSVGYNYSGALGNTSTCGVQYPAKSAFTTLVNVSNGRTYTDIALVASEGCAIGTDGNVYYSGIHDTLSSYPARVFTLGADFSSGLYNSTRVIGLVEKKDTVYGRGYDIHVYTDAGYLYSNSGTYLEVAFNLGYYFVADIYRNEWFTKNGYVFTEWDTKADGTGTAYLPGEKVTMTQAMSLYAQWEKDSNRIRYHAGGGTGNMADTILADGVTAAYLAKNKFTRANYAFAYWCRVADCTGPDASGHIHYADGAYVTGINGYLELYAQWTEKVINYTLVYMKYPYGTAGNTIWKQVSMTNSVSNTTSEIIEGAPYTATGYTVTYDTNKSGSMSTTPVMGTLTAANTTTSAATFNKWQLYEADAAGNQVYYGVQYASGTVVSGMTDIDGVVLYLYPTWSGSDSSVLLPDATCTGYILKGWCESQDGSTEIYLPDDPDSDEASLYVPVKDTTLYAIWEKEDSDEERFDITDTNSAKMRERLRKGNQAIVLKKGYGFHYEFYTTRTDCEEIRITPRYYWVSTDESVREEAQVYYHTVEHGKRCFYLPAGSKMDTLNGQKEGRILLDDNSRKPGVNEDGEVIWENYFYLPSDTYVVLSSYNSEFQNYAESQTLSGQEIFFKKDGYLIVAFQIEMRIEQEWILYETWSETNLAADILNEGWEYQPGDVVRYDLSKRLSEDYCVGGVE